jgi:predicted transcriptional regulator
MVDKLVRIFRYLRNQRGSQAIEFVAILPLFALVILVILQFAMAATAKVTAEAAAMDGARMAMVNGDYEGAARKVAQKYEVTSVSKQDNGDYVTVTVTLQVPLLNNDDLFKTTGLSLPVTAQVTMRKEELAKNP